MKTIKNNIKSFIGIVAILLAFTSCDLDEFPKNVDIVGPTNLAGLESLLNSGYNNLGWPLGGNAQLYAEINGDNINGTSGINTDESEIYNRSTSFFNNTIRDNMYRGFYAIILDANVVLYHIENNLDNLNLNASDARIKEMKGEALFLRAMAHFEISKFMSHSPGYTADNTHLGVPYRTDHTNNTGQNRESVNDNYLHILSDLKEAISLLNATNSSNPNYASKAAAKACMAKVFFQAGYSTAFDTEGSNYKLAYKYANEALTESSAIFDVNLYQKTNGTNRFAGNLVDGNNTATPSVETIFGIVSESQANSKGGTFQRYRSDVSVSNSTIRIMQDLYNSIPSTDLRKSLLEKVENDIFLTKFNRGIFHVPLSHYTELLLIRAEAAAETDNLVQAETDINKILSRAGLSTINGLAKVDLITLIRNQRRIELLGEGNRVNDLKRIGISNSTLTIRNAPWNCNGIIFQFPATEVFTDFIQNPTGGCN